MRNKPINQPPNKKNKNIIIMNTFFLIASGILAATTITLTDQHPVAALICTTMSLLLALYVAIDEMVVK